MCPQCGSRSAHELTGLRRWQCVGCRRQVSLAAGTVLHNTKLPLTIWYWAAYLMTTDKRGISALLSSVSSVWDDYETAWMMLHKFRRAMVNLEREPLRGEVEVDERVDGTQGGLRGSRQAEGRKAALVIVAVEKREKPQGVYGWRSFQTSRVSLSMRSSNKMWLLPQTIYTDGLKSFVGFEQTGFRHIPRTQPLQGDLRKGAKSVVPFADRDIGNLQQWLIGTYHGVSRDQLQVYLDEFVFGTIVARHPWLHSRPCSASAPHVDPCLTRR